MTLDANGAAWMGLEVSLRALAAAAAVALLLRLLQIRAAAVLHAAWTGVLAAMLLMPVLLSIVPALRVPLPDRAGALLRPSLSTEPSLVSVAEHTTRAPIDITATSPIPSGDPAQRSNDSAVAIAEAR